MHRYIGVALWIAFVVVPRRSGSLIDGLPLGPLESGALLAIGWIVLRGSRLSGLSLTAAVLAVSVAIGAAVPDNSGFRARYFATVDATGAVERSTEYGSRDFTRIDRRLDFEPGRVEFPLAFFNDLGRFNFYQPYEPDRELMAFSVIWDGYWFNDGGARPRDLYLDAPGAGAQVIVDGQTVLTVSPLDAAHVAAITAAPGWHELQVRLTSPYGSPRRLSAGEVIAGDRIAFGDRLVSTVRESPWQVSAARIVRPVVTALDLGALAWLSLLLMSALRDTLRSLKEQPSRWTPAPHWLWLLAAIAAVEALVFATPWSSRMMTLVGGDDTLTYESYARQIQMDSFLLARDGGEPFFYQVLYPYALAGMHLMFGESMFGPMLVQRLLLALLVWMVMRIGVRIAGPGVGWAALLSAAAFAYVMVAPVSAKLLNESLFVPLLVTWISAMVVVCLQPTTGGVIGAGVLGGLTALTRSTAILAWVAALLMCWPSWKRTPTRMRLVAVFLACSCSVMSVIAIRNWVVVHQVVLMPGELPVTLYGGNEPPAGLVIDETRHRAFYDRFGLHPFTRQVIEYALTAPGLFLRNLGNKALFALGYFDLYAPGWGYSVGLLLSSVASLAGLVLALRRPAAPIWVVLLPALVALSQYAAVVLVYPKGMRLILPFHAAMLPYTAVTARALWRRVVRV